MLSGIFFIIIRVIELIFLIPPLGMLSAIVHNYVQANELTPAFALTLFVVVVIASVWVLLTMLFYGITKRNAYFVTFIDLCLFGALIGGVVELSPVAGQSCSNFNIRSSIYLESGVWVYHIGQLCNLLKASFAFAIMEIIFFFFSTLILLWVHHHHKRSDRDYKTEKHYSRHSHRRSSKSRNGSRGGSRTRSSRDDRRSRDDRSQYDDRSRRDGNRRNRSGSRSHV